MTTHARFEQLVAMGIDFGLTPADHNDLDDHLATCPTCRSLAAGYRTDTSGLREIARVEPPDRVRTAVLRAAARPAARTIEPWKLLVAAALLLTALMGAAAAIGAWNSRPTLVAVVPTTEPSAGSSAQPSAVPSAVPSASPAGIAPLGDLLFFRQAATEGARNGSAWVVPARGGPTRELGPAIEASWAGDGQSIHLVSQDVKCIPTLTSVSVDGQVHDTVRTGLRSGDSAFAWSPDGRQVVFIRWHTGPPAGECGSQGGAIGADAALQDVIVMNADGSGQRALVPKVSVGRPITWSPDGTQIAVTNNVPDPNDLRDPVVVRIADGLQTPVARTKLDGVSIPRWSPDGTRLAFMTYIGAVKHIGVITIDGGDLRDLGSGDDYAQEPSWSPDGASIAVAFDIASADGTLSPGGIVIHAADGSGRRAVDLPDIQSMLEPPAWSPDGSWLGYIRTAAQGGASDGIALVGVDGLVRREIQDTAGAQWVAWQPAR